MYEEQIAPLIAFIFQMVMTSEHFLIDTWSADRAIQRASTHLKL